MNLRLGWVLTIAASTILLVWAGASLARASSAQQASTHEAQRTALLLEERRSLAGASAWPQWSGEDDLVAARLTACLQAAGLAPECLTSFTPDEPSEPATGVLRQRIAVTLQGLTLPQAGQFLEEFGRRAPEWVVEQIEVTPDGTRKAEPGTDKPIRLTLSSQAIYQGGTP